MTEQDWPVRQTYGGMNSELIRLEWLMKDKDAEIERLRAAIRWALGEAPNEAGKWFGDVRPPLEARYWWRTELRRALETKP